MSIKGSTSVYVDLELSESGNISLSGQEFGSAPEAFWGSDEYEYDLSIPPASWDALIIALGRKFYGGAPDGTAQLIDEMDKAGVERLFNRTDGRPADDALHSETASLVGELAAEFWPRIPVAEKAPLLIALITKHYSGDASVVNELASVLKENGCDYHFGSWC